jgi:DNA uptake protein ComE-like DNA-binding protein
VRSGFKSLKELDDLDDLPNEVESRMNSAYRSEASNTSKGKMPRRTQDSKRATRDTWVPSGMKSAGVPSVPPERPKSSGDTDEWLPIQRPPATRRKTAQNGHAGIENGSNGASFEEAETEPRQAPKRHKLPKRGTPRERWLITRLRRSQRRVKEQQEEIEQLEKRVDELQAAVSPRPKREPAPEKAPPKRSKRAATTRPGNGALDLNRASFEDLRDLGLSVTQSARLVAYRDTGHSFGSVSEVEELPGFGQATLRILRERTTTG